MRSVIFSNQGLQFYNSNPSYVRGDISTQVPRVLLDRTSGAHRSGLFWSECGTAAGHMIRQQEHSQEDRHPGKEAVSRFCLSNFGNLSQFLIRTSETDSMSTWFTSDPSLKDFAPHTPPLHCVSLSGCRYTKIGYAGNTEPQFIMPSCKWSHNVWTYPCWPLSPAPSC